MSKNKTESGKQKLIVAVLMLILVTASILLAKSWISSKNKEPITRHNAVTFSIPDAWKVYQKNQNYDIDLGYFKKGDKKESPTCKINAISANLDRNLTFHQFMQTTLAGQKLIETHSEVNFKGQDAWRGTYEFPAKGIADQAQNDRLLFKYKTVYIDITLSYNKSLDEATISRCKNDYEMFLQNLVLMP